MKENIIADIDKLIAKYQEQADQYTAREKELVCESGEVSQFTWTHSLAAAYKAFVSDLDEVIAKYEM